MSLKEIDPCNIDPCMTPELLDALASMGQGDLIVVADALFPTPHVCKSGPWNIRADGVSKMTMIAAILDLMPLDDTPDETPVYFIRSGERESSDNIKEKYKRIPKVDEERKFTDNYEQLRTGEFLKIARKAFAVVTTRDTTMYGAVILKKGMVYDIGR